MKRYQQNENHSNFFNLVKYSERNVLLVLLVGIIFALNSEIILASTCDAFDNTWIKDKRALTQYEWDEIQKLSFNQGSIKNEMADYDDGFKDYVKVIQNETGKLIFELESAKSKMFFSYSKEAEIFQTDITFLLPYDAKREKMIDMALLYKEICLPGEIMFDEKLSSSMGFQKKPATLILQGKGNSCFSGNDFEKWLITFYDTKNSKKEKYIGSGHFLTHKSVIADMIWTTSLRLVEENITPEKVVQNFQGELTKSDLNWKIDGNGYGIEIQLRRGKDKFYVKTIIISFSEELKMKTKHLESIITKWEKIKNESNVKNLEFKYTEKCLPGIKTKSVFISVDLKYNSSFNDFFIKNITFN